MASDMKVSEAENNWSQQPNDGNSNTNAVDGPSSFGPPSPLTGCYLLIVLGEPHSHEHKDNILQQLLKGLLSWNVLDCHVDLEEELSSLTQHALDGEVARHGERLIQYASENLVTEILIHPQYNTLIQCMRNLLSSFTRHRHIIHSGYTFSGNGSWILQDGTFSVSDFAEALQDSEVQRVMRAYPETISMEIHCAASGLWSALPDKSYAKICKIRINSVDILDSGNEKLNAFIDYLAPMLVPASLNELLESSDVVGNIRFSHPTLYVFPGGQGDAALFGINGFNMLVDGGFNRKSCFWDFTRHLDRLDAVLMTRINNSNIQGISSIIERKKNAHVYPQIGHFFTNIPESKSSISSDGDKDSDPLLVNLFERGHALTSNLKSINLQPQSCYKDIEPINLYHKVGHGTLDMYVISPGKDSKEVKEFLQKWNGRDQGLFATKDSREFQFPLQNLVSICALLVWQPANPEETITRILFPGSTPDYKIIEGLEKMKHLEFMKHPVCTANKLVTSISSNILSKKLIKSALVEKSTPEPILPSKITKLTPQEKDNKNAIDAKIPKSTPAPEKENKISTEPKVIAKALMSEKEKDNKIETKLMKAAQNEKDNKTSTEVIKASKFNAMNEKDNKNGMDSKHVVKSRIDSKPPKSMEKRIKKESSTDKREIGKSSPVTTPKKEQKITNGVAKEKDTKEIKSKILSRNIKSSPSSTPAKSTKEANNRKVLESKQKALKTTKKEVVQTTEKKEIKTERKLISRRTKASSESPVKSIKPKSDKDNVIRKAKLDKGATSDSSVVSTPSADEPKAKKSLDQDKQIILDDLKEEEEAVKEIEAVLKRSEERNKILESDHRTIIEKQDSTTEAEEDEEYIIIEKEEVEQYTEDSINEQESSLTGKEEEIQKHQRDSQESEKKRKPSMETTEEEKEPVVISSTAEKQSNEVDANKAESISAAQLESNDEEQKPIAIGESFIKSEEDKTKEQMVNATTFDADDAKAKVDSREDAAKTDESSPTPEDKQQSSTKKTTDTKDDVELGREHKEGEIINPPESQPFSATVESGATTAPTLPEDEHITLDEIKEDVVIEEKYIKEVTKESQVIVIPSEEQIERTPPKPMQFNMQQPHLRDIIKTPDEVADLPVHEEADITAFEDSAVDAKKGITRKTDDAAVFIDDQQPKTDQTLQGAQKIDLNETNNETDKEEIQDTIQAVLEDKDSQPKIKEGDISTPLPTDLCTPEIEDTKVEQTETNEPISASPMELKYGKTSVSPTSGRKIEDKLTDIREKIDGTAEKVEYMIEELGKSFENTLKDVTNKEKSPDLCDVKVLGSSDDIRKPVDEGKQQTLENVDDVLTHAECHGDVLLAKQTELQNKGPDGEEMIEKKIAKFKEVYDYSHPFASNQYSELRETHITTVDSPVTEKSKLIDLQVIDKQPSLTDDYNFNFEREDSSLNDIKEEDEDRSSPPRIEEYPEYLKISKELSELKETSIDPLTVQAEPPRAISPREEEVFKIVVNVAEVLKSEKDISDIIPDFSEEELEKKLQRASPKLDDETENATVQRMLVTTSSEDGGEEIEICAEGTIKFSPISSTPEVLSGKVTPDVSPETDDQFADSNTIKEVESKTTFDNVTKAISIDTSHELYKESTASSPEAKASPTSVDEKEQHEISEKLQKDQLKDSGKDLISNESAKLKSDEISRKESCVSDIVSILDDSRRESAVSMLSEKDFTKEESSLGDKFSRPNSSLELKDEPDYPAVDLIIESEIAAANSPSIEIKESESISLFSKQTLEEKPFIGQEVSNKPVSNEQTLVVESDHSSRRESATSRLSDRPDSVISHFSDQTEPELKESCDSIVKTPSGQMSPTIHGNSLTASPLTVDQQLPKEEFTAYDSKIFENLMENNTKEASTDKLPKDQIKNEQTKIDGADYTTEMTKPENQLVNELKVTDIKTSVATFICAEQDARQLSDEKLLPESKQTSIASNIDAENPEFSLSHSMLDSKLKHKQLESKSTEQPIETTEIEAALDLSRASSKGSYCSNDKYVKVSNENIDTSSEKSTGSPSAVSIGSHDLKPEEKEPSDKSKDSTRPPSVASDERVVVKECRSPSVASHASGEQEISDMVKDPSRPTSAASHLSEEKHIGSKPEEKGIPVKSKESTIAPSLASDEKVVAGDSRSSSVVSHASDEKEVLDVIVKDNRSKSDASLESGEKEVSNVIKDSSRPTSAASHVSEEKDIESKPEKKEHSEKSKDSTSSLSVEIDETSVEKVSRPVSAASHVSIEKEISDLVKENSRPISATSHLSEEKDIDSKLEEKEPSDKSKDSTRPPSVEGDAKVVEKDSRSVSVAGHVSVERKVSDIVIDSSTIISAASNLSEEKIFESKPEEKEPSDKSKDSTRPPSVEGDAKVVEKDSRSVSVAGHVSVERKVSDIVIDSSTIISAASNLSEEKIFESKPEEKEPSDKSKDSTRPPSVEGDKKVVEKDSRSPSVASHVSAEKEVSDIVKDSLRPISATSHLSEEKHIDSKPEEKEPSDKSKDSTRPPSVEGEAKVVEKDSRSDSTASHVSGKQEISADVKDSSRPISAASNLSEEKIIESKPEEKEPSDKSKDSTRPPSVEGDNKVVEKDSRSPSVASHVSGEKEISGDVKDSSRPISATSHLSEEKHIDSKPEEKEPSVKSKDSTRPPSAEGDAKVVEKDSRSDSTASHVSIKQEISADVKDSSRPISAASNLSEEKIIESKPEEKEPSVKSKDSTRPPSVEGDEKVVEKDSRSPSVASHVSVEKEVVDIVKDSSRPISAASNLSEEKIVESKPEEKDPSDKSKDSTKPPSVEGDEKVVERDSRSVSIASHFSGEKEISGDVKDSSRPISVASHLSEEKHIDLKPEEKDPSDKSKDSTRPPSVEGDEKVVEKDSRSPSVASHVSAEKEVVDIVKDSSRPISAASNLSEEKIFESKPEEKEPSDKSKDSTRPPSVEGDEKVVERDSRSPSVASHVSIEKEVSYVVKDSSRPTSVASYLSEEKIVESKPEEKDPSDKSKDSTRPPSVEGDEKVVEKDSRSVSIASHFSGEKEISGDVKDSSRPISVASHLSEEKHIDSKPEEKEPSDKSKGSTRPPSVEGDEKVVEKDSRSPSVASHVSIEKEVSDIVKDTSRPISAASNLSEEKIIESKPEEKDPADKSKDSTRPPSVEADEKVVEKDGRSVSVGSHVSIEKEVWDVVKDSSRPISAASNLSEKKIIESKPEQKEPLDKSKDLTGSPSVEGDEKVAENNSRSVSIASHVSVEKEVFDIVKDSSRPISAASNLSEEKIIESKPEEKDPSDKSKDSTRPPSVEGDEKVAEKDSRSVSIASHFSSEKEISSDVKDSSRPISVASHLSEEKHIDLKPEEKDPSAKSKNSTSPPSVEGDEKVVEKDSRSPSVPSHVSVEKEVVDIVKDSSRPISAASNLSEEKIVESKPEEKDPSDKSKDSTRPPSVEGDEKVVEKDSRSVSIASHFSGEKEISGDVKDSSRPISVASHLSEEKHIDLKPEEKDPSAKSKDSTRSPSVEGNEKVVEKDSRSPSVASHVSVEKEVVDIVKDSSRPISAASNLSEEKIVESKPEEKEPSDKSKDSTRPPSVEGDEKVVEKDSRSPSVASHVSIEKEVSDIVKDTSRPISAASNLSEEKIIESKPEEKDPADKSKDSNRPPSVEGDEKVAEKDSRSPSVASHVSVEKLVSDIVKDSSRPISAASNLSEEKIIESRPEEKEPSDKSKDSTRPPSVEGDKKVVEKDSRSPSVASHVSVEKQVSDIVKDSSRPISVTSNLSENEIIGTKLEGKEPSDKSKDSTSPPSAEGDEKVVEKDSRSVSVASHVSVEKEISDVVKGALRPPLAASHLSEEKHIDSKPEENETSDKSKDLTRPPSVEGDEKVVEKDSRSHSVASHVSIEKEISDDVKDSSSPISSHLSEEKHIDSKPEKKEPSAKSKDSTRPPSANSEVNNAEPKKEDVELTSAQFATGSTISSVFCATGEKIIIEGNLKQTTIIQKDDKLSSRPELVAGLSDSAAIKTAEEIMVKAEETNVKGSRSKSVASITVAGIGKLESSTLGNIVELSKDDLEMGGASRKTSDISTLIDDVRKIDEKFALATEGSKTVNADNNKSSISINIKEELANEGFDAEALNPQTHITSSIPDTDTMNQNWKSISETTTSKTATAMPPSSDKPENVMESINTVLSSSESCSLNTTIDLPTTGQCVSKEVTAIKSELRSYTPVSDDYNVQDVYSPRSDISSGQATRVMTGCSDSESHPYSDEEIPDSPYSTMSKAVSSSPRKFSYEGYDLQRSGSGVSKKSDLDIDDSQDDIPPQYGSHEVESAISITSSFKIDPMSTSFYGELPSTFDQSDPITITTVRTVVTKQYEDYHSSGPDESSSYASQESYKIKAGDHKFLDEADLDFEKAMEEHRQVRGSDVMSSVTSKYEFSPTSRSHDQTSTSTTQEFPLSEVKQTKTELTKEEIASSAAVLAQQVEDNLKKAEERVASWGKPLGLPSPLPTTDNSTTPKKERRLVATKTKLNNEKNLRKRSESPAKGKKLSPIYMDLTYVPHNGNSYYAHVEFFKRVRARYYVFSGTEPSRDVYNALLEAKQTWENKDLEVTIIPTYDTDVLGYWVSENEDLLAKHHIDLSPSASRCTINLQDHETSCSAYRLEF